MKTLVILSVVVAVAFGKHCAPDRYMMNLLGQEAFEPSGEKSESVVMDLNETVWIDFKKKMVAFQIMTSLDGKQFTQIGIQDFNKMEMTMVDYVDKKCSQMNLTQAMPNQCVPENATNIANFTSVGGAKMSVVRFHDSNDRLVTMVYEMKGNMTIPLMQTAAFRTDQGSGFVTQMYGVAGTKFDDKVFTIPDFCKKN